MPAKYRVFLAGILTGICLLLLPGTAYILSKGVQVNLESIEIAGAVGEQVTYYAGRDLPAMIEAAKKEIPAIVEKEMEGQLGSSRMEIAGFSFALPSDLINQLETFMRLNVENSVYRLLDGIDTSGLSEEIGQTAVLIVQEQMRETLHGKTFYIDVPGPLDLPVTVNLR